MAIKEQVKRKGSLWKAREKSLLMSAAELGIVLLLGATLSSAKVFGSCAPFGIALVAAAGAGLNGLFALLGSLLGYLYFQGVESGLHYGAATVLTYAVLVALHDLKVTKKAWFAPVVAASLCAVTSFIHQSAFGFTGGAVIFYITELFLVVAGTLCFRGAFTAAINQAGQIEVLSPSQRIGMLALGGSCLIALSGVTIFGEFSVGRIVAAVVVMTAARRGVHLGLLSGTIVGIAMDAASGQGPYYCLAYALSGLLSGLCWNKGKTATALAYIAANGAAVLWTWESGMRVALLYEVFVASVLFMIIPARLRQLGGQMLALPKPRNSEWEQAKRVAAQQMQKTARAFRELYESIRDTFRPERGASEDPAVIFHRTAERQCRKCASRESCWQRHYQDTQRALNDATRCMMERGKAQGDDFPSHFRNRCHHFTEFLRVVNEELTAFLYRKQYQGRMEESRAALCRQYAELDRILGKTAAELSAEITPDLPREGKLNSFLRSQGLAEDGTVYFDEKGHLRVELPRSEKLLGEEGRDKLSQVLEITLREGESADPQRLSFHQAEPFKAVASVSGRSKEGEEISGDTGTWFRREDGLLCILLCDGMGSGPEARKESSLAVRLLQNFLKAGVEPEAALSTVNSALTLKGEKTGGCTTVDLLTIELYTGVCSVYKYGAAPSYLKKGDKISCIKGSALPAGIVSGDEAKPDMTRFRGREGDWIILLSDGLVSGDGDQWLRTCLAEFEGTSPGELAEKLLAESKKQADVTDDSTVIAVRLEQRS